MTPEQLRDCARFTLDRLEDGDVRAGILVEVCALRFGASRPEIVRRLHLLAETTNPAEAGSEAATDG
jgi:hypothetical protein